MLLRKKLAVVLAATLMLALSGSPAAFAAPNPSGTGQPGVECGDPGATDAPAGFSTGGFANAEEHYADSEDSHAVSQYDVACYQVTNKGGV
ncbi:MAG TPA: hypothetical protein VFI90_06140 [Rubrobacter sp.]|nr:hypothetical protein [Rubrobacter sp.]